MINALLGNDILPTNLQASTARITTITYAKEPKIILHLTDGTQEEADYSTEYIKALSANNPEKLERISSIELFYPSDLLKEGIRFIDTPGTNDTDQQRVDITYKLIPSVDAVVYVTIYPVTASNLNTFKTLILENGILNRFIALNKSDLFDYAEAAIDDASQLFEELTKQSAKIYPLSSFDYLEGKLDKDNAIIAKSNFSFFLSDLEQFITSSKKFDNLGKQLNYKFNTIKNNALELLQIRKQSLIMPDDVFQERKDTLLAELTKYRNEGEELKQDIHTEFNKLNSKLYGSLDKLMDDIIQTTDIMLSQRGADLSVMMKQIEYSIKNKYQMWQNKNKAHVNRYVETLSKEIDLRLGQVSHNITTSLVKFSEEAPVSGLGITNKAEGTNQLDERKQSVTLGVASVGVYAGLASVGFALAPVAMLIMPLGMYFMQKKKAEEMEALKSEAIKTLQLKGVEFKEEVLRKINKTEKDFTNEIEKRVDGFADKIESQLESTEQERKGMEADLQNKAEYLSDIRKEVLAL